MEENKKKFNWSIVAIIALACLMVFCLVKISDLSNEISNLHTTISNYQNQVWSLNNEINSIYDNVDELLKKEASLLSSVDYSLGELNTETHTVPVTLKVVPKSLTDDMQLSVKIGSETVALERNGNEFSATVAVNMFIDYDDYPMLNIVSGETTKTEKLEDVEVSRLFTLYLPYVYAHLGSSDVLKNGKLAIDGILMFDEKPVASNSKVTITKIEFITVKNEQEIDRKDITSNVTTQSYHIPVNVSYDAKYGDKFCIYVLAKDSLGYTHKTLVVLLLASTFVVPAYANSAQTHWRGVDSTGAVVVDGNCPIEVTKEVLTFDVSEFPDNYYREMDEYLAYTGKVTAEYTFYNPTDLTVTATLAFPFGTQPDYASLFDDETQAYLPFADTEKYDITINGEAIDKEIRYTLKPYGVQFKLSEDLPRLSDTYIADAFYSPTMTVTKYTYIVGGANKEGLIDKETYNAANVAFDWDGGDGKSKIYFPEQSGFHTQKDGDGRFGMWADNGDIFSVYVIGQPLSTPLVMKCYQDGGVEDKEEIDGIVSLTNTETMTLEELALENWKEETGVSKVDWYNAVVAAFNEGSKGNPTYNYIYPDSNGLNMSAERFMNSLMRWYQYEITIEPKSSITNTVTAPIYPEINGRYEPSIYTYTYLLSPASTWASFGELEVVINTPFYITENSLEGFTKTETGYTLKRNGLPGGELEFTLSTSENPTKPPRSITSYIPIEIIISFSIIGGVILLIGGGITAFVIVRKKKKNK